MRKTARGLAITAACIYFLSLCLYAVAIVFQQVLVPLIMPSADEFIFMLPIAPTVYILTIVLLAFFACLSVGSNRVGIWPEVLLICLAVFLVNPLYSILSAIEPQLLVQQGMSYQAIIARNYVITLVNYAFILNPLALAMFYVSNGMSIGYKCTRKKLLRHP